jgi:predicted Rdx family selenoprotein
MAREDEEKTAFVTPRGLYCYVNMPYGLKNALATFVRATHITLGPHIGKILELYVDDIVVKTRKSDSILSDLDVVFQSLRRNKMMLNPEKCVFGVAAGKLLGFLVSHRGIEANPEKIRAIDNMKPPTCIKHVQRLTGSMAALSRFISKLEERALPFFKLLRGAQAFQWDDKAEEAFRDLKSYLSSPPVLVAPLTEEPLLLHIAATTDVVSMVLVAERDEPIKHGPNPREPIRGPYTEVPAEAVNPPDDGVTGEIAMSGYSLEPGPSSTLPACPGDPESPVSAEIAESPVMTPFADEV